jgi:hypothetical protein
VQGSDAAVVGVAGATSQGEGVDSLDQHVLRSFRDRAGQSMSRGQVLLGDIQCGIADSGVSCADQLPSGLVWVAGHLVHLGGLP